jgi:chromosome segregation ATPase
MSLLSSDANKKSEDLSKLRTTLATTTASLDSVSLELEELQEYRKGAMKELSNKERIICALREELQNAVSEGVSVYERETSNLRDDIRALKLDLAMRDDEIRDLRVIDLYEKEERIVALEREKDKLSHQLNCKTQLSDARQGELEQEIRQLRKSMNELEKIASDRNDSLQEEINKQIEAFTDVKREADYVQIQLLDRERKLDDVNTELKNLSERLRQMQQNEDAQQNECRTLRLEKEELRQERDKLALIVGNHNDEKKSFQSAQKDLESQCNGLNARLKNQDNLMLEQQHRIHMLETDIKETKTFMDELARYNKELEMTLQTQASAADDIDKEVRLLRRKVAEKESEFVQCKAEWTEKEKELCEQVSTEQNLHEIAMSELEATRRKLEAVIQDNKETAELEKECARLRDKVQRQDAYLRRKLEKEKALRSRANGVAVPPPSAQRPRRSVSLTNSGMTTPHRSFSLTSSCMATPLASNVRSQSLVESPLNDSLDWELDSLLAD